MKSFAFSAILLTVLLAGCNPPESHVAFALPRPSQRRLESKNIVSVETFGNLRIGNSVPRFSATSVENVRITATEPDGAFYIHLIQAGLPAACIDEECGREAMTVIKKGGHLFGFSGGKTAGLFGIDLAETTTEESGDSLAVVTDENGKIMALFPHATLRYIPLIAEGVVAPEEDSG